MVAALEARHDVIVSDVLHLRVAAGRRVFCDGQLLIPRPTNSEPSFASLHRRESRVSLDLRDALTVLVRTSPGRDGDMAWAHRFALQALALAAEQGAQIVNDPTGLGRASSKLYSACLPENYTPSTLVTRNPEAARAFIRSLAGPAVIKPLVGSGGRDIFFVDGADAENLDEICAVLGRSGYFVVQEYVDEIEDGDLRVLLLDGKVLELEGEQAVIHRVPKVGQFRSNVSLGARARAGYLSKRQTEVANEVAQEILADGIRLAGLDMVADCILEVNVFSTGGLNDADRFYRRPFTRHVLERLIEPP
jgi:glutathione synthase